jgi:hypothetical protein
MQKTKLWFWFTFVLALALTTQTWASGKDMPVQNKIRGMKSPHFLQKEAEIPLPPYLWPSEETQRLVKTVTGTGAISGYVTQASGGAPIQDVVIMADQLACPSYSYYGFSGTDGFYIIEDLPPGHYEVQTYNYTDFVDVHWDNKLPWEDADSVSVASDDTTEDIDFSLRVGGKISGSVTLPGASDEGTTVFAYESTSRYSYSTYAYSGSPTGKAVPYEIAGLPTGNYKVQTLNFWGFIDVYYDDQSSWEDADLVSVTEGIITSPVDFTLDSGGVIQGDVSYPGKTLSMMHMLIAWFALNPEWLAWWLPFKTVNYELTGLRSGPWKVLAYGDSIYACEWWDNKSTWADADCVWVTAPGTVAALDFSLEVGGSISGHVWNSRVEPLPACEVIAYETSSFYQSGEQTLAYWAKSDSTSGDGSYKIGGLPTGTYYVGASTACQQMWYDNKIDMQDADPVSVTMPGETPNIDFFMPTAVESDDDVTLRPDGFELDQNYPNPFNPETRIEYRLKKRGHVILHVYNILGEKVRTLLDHDQPAGFYEIKWDGKTDTGNPVSSGLYLYKLEVNGVSQAKRMVLLK